MQEGVARGRIYREGEREGRKVHATIDAKNKAEAVEAKAKAKAAAAKAAAEAAEMAAAEAADAAEMAAWRAAEAAAAEAPEMAAARAKYENEVLQLEEQDGGKKSRRKTIKCCMW